MLYYTTDRGEEKKTERSHFIANLSHIKKKKRNYTRDLHVDKRKLPFKFQNARVHVAGDPYLPSHFSRFGNENVKEAASFQLFSFSLREKRRATLGSPSKERENLSEKKNSSLKVLLYTTYTNAANGQH